MADNSSRSQEQLNERISVLMDQVNEGVKNVCDSEEYKKFLDFVSKLPTYSIRNMILLYQQKPDLSIVQSYNAWKAAGRMVNKGEHGLQIICPAFQTEKKTVPDVDFYGRQKVDSNGIPMTKEQEITIRRYTIGHVFDVSQTNGEDLPSISPTKFSGDYDGYKELSQAIAEISPAEIRFGDTGDANGYFRPSTNEIVISQDLINNEQFSLKVMFHELAHACLHGMHGMNPNGSTPNISRTDAEIQALY